MLKPLKTISLLLTLGLSTAFLGNLGEDSPAPIGPYLNGIFPPSVPGAGGSWELEDLFPDQTFDSPTRIIPFPGSSDILVLSKSGDILRMSMDGQRKMILDFKDRAFKKGEAGAVGMALHPAFGNPDQPNKQLIFVFYRTKPEPDKWSEQGFNRLSKFSWDPATETFDLSSEEVLIQQYDRSTWHNGGALVFDPEGYLYVSLGDEGNAEYRAESAQQIDGGFFSGVLRIDVDNNPTRSHAIRRQPKPNTNPPAGWGETFSQGYSIPNDNPWVDPSGNTLEEFYAIGLRSPFVMTYDQPTRSIWVADVGSSKNEEISILEAGDNLQWPYMEGEVPIEDFPKPDNLIGREKAPFLALDRTRAVCVIGGLVYRGTRFPELSGKYLFADYVYNTVRAATLQGSNSKPKTQTLVGLWTLPSTPPEAGITGLFVLPDGHVLISVKGEDFANTGKIYRLKRKTEVEEPPAKLSDLGIFADLNTLEPEPGIIPYRVNAPLWSDRAVKQRWIAIPNDGTFDTPGEQINFKSTQDWTFPEGTVFIKHFELPLSTDGSRGTKRLETRFFILGEGGQGYGLTYRWNEEGTEAFLLGGGDTKEVDVFENGTIAFSQTWDFPSREQCMSCHTNAAGFVLGVKTHQLNGELFYPDLGQSMNQLEYLNRLGVFQRDIGPADRYPKSYPIGDASVDLETRIRSYLDANCSSCHRPGGVPTTSMDTRFYIPLQLQNLINLPTQSMNSDPDHLIVTPGYHEKSELWVRDASINENRMPPLARNMVDEAYVEALANWIDGLESDAGSFRDFLLFPNPNNGNLGVRISDNWEPPFLLRVWNATGQLIREVNQDSRSAQISLVNHQAGIYVLEVTSANERVVKRFLVK